MKIEKTEIKAYLNGEIQKNIENAYGDNEAKYWRRVESMCRASINRLSYTLCREDTGKVYIIHGDRIRIIEAKSNDLNLSAKVFSEAQTMLKNLANRFLQDTEVAANG